MTGHVTMARVTLSLVLQQSFALKNAKLKGSIEARPVKMAIRVKTRRSREMQCKTITGRVEKTAISIAKIRLKIITRLYTLRTNSCNTGSARAVIEMQFVGV